MTYSSLFFPSCFTLISSVSVKLLTLVFRSAKYFVSSASHVKKVKECVAVLIGSYKKNGAVSCIGFDKKRTSMYDFKMGISV